MAVGGGSSESAALRLCALEEWGTFVVAATPTENRTEP